MKIMNCFDDKVELEALSKYVYKKKLDRFDKDKDNLSLSELATLTRYKVEEHEQILKEIDLLKETIRNRIGK
jgi:hypothetical protein